MIYFDIETRQFAVSQMMKSNNLEKANRSMAKNSQPKQGGNFMGKLGTGLNLAGGAVSLVSGLAGMKKMLNTRYSVVFLNNNGPQHKSVIANSPIEAVEKIKKSTSGSKYRAFRLPDQDDQSQDYFTSLKQ